MIKKYLSIACVCALLIGMAGVVADKEIYQPPKKEQQVAVYVPTTIEKYEAAMTGKADLLFWYDDAGYENYLTHMAANYYEETGVLVDLAYVDTMDYVGEIYDATMHEERYPDVYLLSGEELEKAHLYGVAGENKTEAFYVGVVADNAITASK